MKMKRLFETVFLSLVVTNIAITHVDSNPMDNNQQNTSTNGISERAIFQTLIAGLKMRESSMVTASAYFTTERYFHDNPDLRQAHEVYAVQDPNMKAWAQMFEKSPKLTLKFWAADGIKVREDEKPLVSPDGGDYTLSA